MVNLSDEYDAGNLTEVRKSMGVNPRAGGGMCFPNPQDCLQGPEVHGDEKPCESSERVVTVLSTLVRTQWRETSQM